MNKQLYILPLFLLWSCHTEQNIEVDIDVEFHIKDDNHTSPLSVAIENRSKSADEYLWTFEGGEPSTSNRKDPGVVVFTQPGDHTVTLEAWNDGNKQVKTFSVRVDSTVTAGFTTSVEENNYAPARFKIANLSTGGTTFNWTFEGGNPESYGGQHPPVITYNEPGKYKILLVVNNGSATFKTEQTVEVKESLYAGFTIVPSLEDEDDMEAPVRAAFDTELIGVESLKWECTGATITNPTSADAKILFPSPGTYTVTLTVTNNKQTKTVEKSVTVKENTNLRTHRSIKLGINTAQNNIGVFYSTRLRRIISNAELDDFGEEVDIAFFGLNSVFAFNKFVSPSVLGETPLKEITNPQNTKFINRTEQGNIILSVSDFNAMTTDALLKNLSIKNATYGDEAFDNSILPRVVLFETEDGRKGAILVKEMIADGRNSYITADIKVQKND